MVQSRDLAVRFEAYADWRRRLSAAISSLHEWLSQQELADAQVDLKVQQLLERLHQDKLVVAFVAEFKNYADEWVTIGLDLASADRMSEVLSRVSQVKTVPVELARRYGLFDDKDDLIASFDRKAEGMIDIPCWRHAVINFPHPLLQQGLVILDTPGLNAIGTEPELTLSHLPNAHALLFILSADAGVTKTDLAVWNDYLAGDDDATRAGRLVILNKIDGLWDDMRSGAEVEAEIDRQVRQTATVLDVPPTQVYAVSAQKGLLAKVNGDDALLARSKLPQLELALSRKLIPAKRDIVGAATQSEVREVIRSVRTILRQRASGIDEQLAEMRALRGKNQDVIQHMMDRVKEEKDLFERGLARYTALRNVFTEQTTKLLDYIGLEALKLNAGRTRRAIESSLFTKGVRGALGDFFGNIREDLDKASRQSTEIHEMMRAMYARFAKEHNVELYDPPAFSVLKYRKEVERLERAYNQHFNTLWNMASKAKFALMRRFFETVATRVKHVYDIANRDVEAWLKAVMAPLETQVREHHVQLRRRLDSIKRIHRAGDELEERIVELEQQAESINLQIRGLKAEIAVIDDVVAQPEMPLAANG